MIHVRRIALLEDDNKGQTSNKYQLHFTVTSVNLAQCRQFWYKE